MRVHIKCIMPYGVLIKNSRDSSHKPLRQSGLLPPFRSSSSSSQLCPLPPITIFSEKMHSHFYLHKNKYDATRTEALLFHIPYIYSRTFAACRINKYIRIYGKTTMTPTVAPVNVTMSTTSVLVCSNLPPPSYVSV